jgi:hypothetical protein
MAKLQRASIGFFLPRQTRSMPSPVALRAPQTCANYLLTPGVRYSIAQEMYQHIFDRGGPLLAGHKNPSRSAGSGTCRCCSFCHVLE